MPLGVTPVAAVTAAAMEDAGKVTAVFLGGGFAVDSWRMSRDGGDAPARDAHAVPEEPSLPEVPVRVPETYTE